MPSQTTFILGIYLTQALLSALLAALLLWFRRAYHHRHLADWSLSWTCLCVYHVCAGAILHALPYTGASDATRLGLSWVSLTAGLWQPAFLGFGTWVLATGRAVRRAWRVATLIAVPIAALVIIASTVAVSSDIRFLSRVGVRSFLSGVGFLVAAWGITRGPAWNRSVGRRILVYGFVLYALDQFCYVAVSIPGLAGNALAGSAILVGFLDFVLQAILALGMVMWHLEEERAALGATDDALRQSEENLRQAQKMEVMGRLAGGVAHDFNNILTVIFGDVEFLRDTLPVGHPALTHADQIDAAARRARSLTGQLLAFSRKQVVRPRRLDLDITVGSMTGLIQRVTGSGIEVVVAAHGRLPAVFVDAGQIEQVILNLVVNSRDAMPKGGRLTLATSHGMLGDHEAAALGMEPCEFAELTVTDTGAGMSESVQEHIFEPFFTTKPPGRGTGLGLSTAFGIVKQAGGGISVKSVPGQGTTVRIVLKAVPGPADEPGSDSSSPVRRSSSGTVLLVDDEREVRGHLGRYLRERGFVVFEAADGAEALRILEEAPAKITAAVSDVVMPVMDGIAFARRAGAIRADLPVLLISGHRGEDAPEPDDLGPMVRWLQKPFTLPAFGESVDDLLASAEPESGAGGAIRTSLSAEDRT